MNEPPVNTSARERIIDEKALNLEAFIARTRLPNGLLEVVFLEHNDSKNIIERMLFDGTSESEKCLVHEVYEGGMLKKRISNNVEEIYDDEGSAEKRIVTDDEILIHRLKNGFYGAEHVPAIELLKNGEIIEQVWYEGVKKPGEAVVYGSIHRNPVKCNGKWCYEPARVSFDPETRIHKSFRFIAGELQDTPDGSPAIIEHSGQKILSEVRLSHGMLHGKPAVKGTLDCGTEYKINVDQGRISDIPSIPGMSLSKGNSTVNVHFSSNGSVMSRETVVDLSDFHLTQEEQNEAILMIHDMVRSHFLNKVKQDDDLFEPFAEG